MKSVKNLLFYIFVIGGFSLLTYLILSKGLDLQQGRVINTPKTGTDSYSDFLDAFKHNLQHPLALLLVQIVTIILAARFMGWLCQRIGQPAVVGEIIAGIMLGPSLLGMYLPDTFGALFPQASLGNLQFLSQIGLIFFMFIVGMELDLKVLKNTAHEAVVISHASIVVPFGLGIGLAYFIYSDFAPQGVEFMSFALFMGIAMSITAFPVLARIVQERGIHKTKLGMVVITCAAADDITAWCILAAVIAIVKAGSFTSSIYTIILAITYVFVMLKLVRPFLRRIGDLNSGKESINKPVVAIFFLTMLLSSYATEIIGIHALFGAFMAGVIMPESPKFRHMFTEKLEDVSLVVLLPLFFVFTGLRTQIGLLNDSSLWITCAVIIAIAVTGKFVGSAFAAKFVGQSWRDSLIIGALMNTRGLMELVVLNIGYDLGVLTPEVFAMMVIMALVTTFMTGPALDLINKFFKKDMSGSVPDPEEQGKYKILVSFATPEKGRALLRLANSFTKKMGANADVTAMHLSHTEETHHYNIDEYEKRSFIPIINESRQLNQKITTLFKVSNDIDTDITDVANKGEYDMLLVGLGQSIFEGSLLGRVLGFTTRFVNPERLLDTFTGKEKLFENSPFDDRTRQIVSNSKIPVGMLIDKKLRKVERVCVPILFPEDLFILQYAQKLISNAGSSINILDAADQVKKNNEIQDYITYMQQSSPQLVKLHNASGQEKDFLKEHDLIILSLNGWKKVFESHSNWLSNSPSVLIIKA